MSLGSFTLSERSSLVSFSQDGLAVKSSFTKIFGRVTSQFEFNIVKTCIWSLGFIRNLIERETSEWTSLLNALST